MVTWELLTDEAALNLWDENLSKFNDHSFYQTFAWGEYNRALGWQPHRWAAFDDAGEIVAMMQGMLRRYPLGVGLVWGEGGPVGDLSIYDANLQQAIARTTKLKRVYCRFRCDRARQVEDALRLTGQGWARSWYTITSNWSMSLDLSKDEDQLLAECSKEWRKNLRRAERCDLRLRLWLDPDIDEIFDAHVSMEKLKNLGEQFSKQKLVHIFKHLKQNILLYRCDDEQGVLASLYGCAVVGNRAWNMFAVTSERGRDLRASYATFWELIRHCRRIGVQHYDLGGIDPIQNPGVYNFKKGTGAAPLEYLGEWDWAPSAWLRWAGNWSISQRSQIRHKRGLRECVAKII